MITAVADEPEPSVRMGGWDKPGHDDLEGV
jgi:hypothetical protein